MVVTDNCSGGRADPIQAREEQSVGDSKIPIAPAFCVNKVQQLALLVKSREDDCNGGRANPHKVVDSKTPIVPVRVNEAKQPTVQVKSDDNCNGGWTYSYEAITKYKNSGYVL